MALTDNIRANIENVADLAATALELCDEIDSGGEDSLGDLSDAAQSIADEGAAAVSNVKDLTTRIDDAKAGN